MKICAPATSNPDFDLNLLDEINILYTKRHNIEQVVEFYNIYQKRINLYFENDMLSIDSLKMLNKCLNNNLYIRLPYAAINEMKQLEDNDIKYFLDFPIDSYIKLRWVFECTKSTDIYITDDLCYNLKEIKKHCNDKNIQIRMILNRIPSTFEFAGMLYDSPIFRPQDFDLLDKYIDVGEFDCWDDKGKYEWNRFNILYKRWYDKKKWNEDLRLLNEDVKFPYITKLITDSMCDYRTECKHRCLTFYSSPCSICSQNITLSHLIDEKTKSST